MPEATHHPKGRLGPLVLWQMLARMALGLNSERVGGCPEERLTGRNPPKLRNGVFKRHH